MMKKPSVRLKNCFASKDVCTAIKLCPVKAVSYIEVDEPILDKVLSCNCNEREARGLTPMSVDGYSSGCDCAGGCENEGGDPLYDCGGTPYGRIIIDYDICIRCGICAKECCGDAIDMVDESERISGERLLAVFTKKPDEIDAIKQEAEAQYMGGGYCCSEAVIVSLRKHLVPDMPEEAIAMGSGFCAGIGGAMCTCGAVTGGVLVLGCLFGRVIPGDAKGQRAKVLSKELYDHFLDMHKTSCCKALIQGMDFHSTERRERCTVFVGDMAAKTAELIARERDMNKE